MPNTNISMLVTSCNRHDLLKTTLESFYAICDQEPQELIVFEDSPAEMPEFLKDFKWKCRGLRWIAGGERRGQAFACAKLITEAKHDFVFWCEDDWLFQNRLSPFMRESKDILNNHSHIICVTLRGDTGWHPLVCSSDGLYIPEPYWRGVWGGWAWNPGLRRLKDCRDLILPNVARQIGQSGLTHEEALSKLLLDMGYRIADLNRPIITHIGGCRSRAIEQLPPLPKILIAVPTCFSFDYESHGGGPGCAATGFHQNGPNEQVKAVRETWGADVKAYKRVDLKFFYGKPKEGYPRAPEADEVFLEVPDGYDSLIAKTVEVCRYAAENGYKFLFKADDDTAVYVEKLLIEILENNFDYAGYLHGGVCSGGPGYLLSAHACRIIATQGRQPQHSYAEDVHVSRVLANAGIKPLMLPQHRPGFSEHYFFGPRYDESRLTPEMVTLHSVTAEQMRIWHSRQKKS